MNAAGHEPDRVDEAYADLKGMKARTPKYLAGLIKTSDKRQHPFEKFEPRDFLEDSPVAILVGHAGGAQWRQCSGSYRFRV